MKVVHYTDVPAETAEQGAEGVSLRWAIGEEDGAPNFAMRVFEIERGGHTPFHDHPWEHEVFILAGAGQIKTASGEHDLREGTVVYVEPGESHQFVNAGDGVLRLICIVPKNAYCR